MEGDTCATRKRPENEEIEMALLAKLLVDNRTYHNVGDFLRADHFSLAVHGRIYEAIGRLIDQGRDANPPALKNLFDQDGTLEDVGGAQYLARLVANGIYVGNTRHYAEQIFDLWQRREILSLCNAIGERCLDYRLDNSAKAVIADAEERLFELDRLSPSASQLQPLSTAMTLAIEQAEKVYRADGAVIGTPTGINTLDHKLGGLFPTDLIVIAGRPAMGKTALATGIAVGAAEHVPGIFFSLEMSQDQLAARILAGITGISSDRQRRGPIASADIEALMEGKGRFDALQLFIDDTPVASVAHLRSKVAQLKMRGQLGFVVVDYLQLIVASAQNRTQEISKITRDLKVMAKEFRIPVIALSQLSRAGELREDKRPNLSDLRDSGSIEQDADIVIFTYREWEYLRREYPQKRMGETEEKLAARLGEWWADKARCEHEAQLIIAKNRHGKADTLKLRFDGETTTFSDIEQREQRP